MSDMHQKMANLLIQLTGREISHIGFTSLEDTEITGVFVSKGKQFAYRVAKTDQGYEIQEAEAIE
jgi:hypothetical protein